MGLAFVLMLRPFVPELVMSTDLLSFEHPSLLLFCFSCSEHVFFKPQGNPDKQAKRPGHFHLLIIQMSRRCQESSRYHQMQCVGWSPIQMLPSLFNLESKFNAHLTTLLEKASSQARMLSSLKCLYHTSEMTNVILKKYTRSATPKRHTVNPNLRPILFA